MSQKGLFIVTNNIYSKSSNSSTNNKSTLQLKKNIDQGKKIFQTLDLKNITLESLRQNEKNA